MKKGKAFFSSPFPDALPGTEIQVLLMTATSPSLGIFLPLSPVTVTAKDVSKPGTLNFPVTP